MTSQGRSSPLLEARNIWVVYSDGTVANKGVSLTLYEGEIHGLVGENGAGKTSFVHVLYGVVRPSAGEIYIQGVKTRIASPQDARRHGIFMVPQHNVLIPTLTGLDNIRLSNGAEAVDRVYRLVDELGIDVDLDTPVERLERGMVKKIEVLRALATGAKIVILDEPTSVMSPVEVEDLSRLLKTLRGAGYSFIFISHRLDEVVEICDRVTVLRDGQVAYSGGVDEVEKLYRLMFRGEEYLEASSMRRISPMLRVFLGIEGNGQEELARKYLSGSRGFTGYVPGNPYSAMVPGMSLVDNVRFRVLDRDIDYEGLTLRIVRSYEVVARDIYTPIDRLSGGNMQRFIVGREVELSEDRCVLMYPTRGLDMRSMALVHRRVWDAVERGCEVIYFTEDMEEALMLGGMISVVYRGRVSEPVSADEADVDRLKMLMSGIGWS